MRTLAVNPHPPAAVRRRSGQIRGGGPHGLLPRPGRLNEHFQALGVPRDLSRILALRFYRWQQCEGPEAAVKRLKALLNEELTGVPTPWQRRVNGESETLAQLRSVDRNVRLRVLRCYTFVKLKRVTATQEKKFFSSMAPQWEDGGVPTDSRWWESRGFLERLPQGRRPWVPSVRDFLSEKGRPRAHPRLDRRGRLVPSKPKEAFGLSEVEAYTADWQSRGLLPTPVLEKLRKELHPRYLGEIPVGVVAAIQEKGAKLRAVASPHPSYQWVLGPLASVLYEALRGLEEDCTFDQSKAMPVIRSWLQDGETVHSVDLSDATNQFPLEYQLELLRDWLGERWSWQVDIFEAASRGQWVVGRGFPNHPAGSEVKWTKGQPLGLRCSFPSFALAHNALLWFLRELVGGDYRVLGDDVVIRGDRLAREYKRWLQRLGVQYSAEKTITSSQLAEFAGMVITRGGWANKWNWAEPTSDGALGRLFRYGGSYQNYLHRLDKLSSLPVPVKASLTAYHITPRFLGGANGEEWAWWRAFSLDESPEGPERMIYPGLPGRVMINVRRELRNALPPFLRGWRYEHLAGNVVSSSDRRPRIAGEWRPSRDTTRRFVDSVLEEYQRQKLARAAASDSSSSEFSLGE